MWGGGECGVVVCVEGCGECGVVVVGGEVWRVRR